MEFWTEHNKMPVTVMRMIEQLNKSMELDIYIFRVVSGLNQGLVFLLGMHVALHVSFPLIN